jgi:dephospho-CoA kinase
LNSKQIKIIIVVMGRICSGKTYISEAIAKKFNIPIGSFGGYLKHYCETNNLPIDRKTLQCIGENFINLNPQLFLKNVTNHFIGKSNSIIIEGVRHKIILDSIKEISAKSILIFIDVDSQIRYERFCNRIKDLDKIKTYDQFLLTDNHSVELETESLKCYCDMVIDSATDFRLKLFEYISLKLN